MAERPVQATEKKIYFNLSRPILYNALFYAGMFSMSLLSMSSDSHKMKLYEARANFNSCMKNKGLVSSLIGGGILGAGMTVAGTVCIIVVYTLLEENVYLHNRDSVKRITTTICLL